MLVVKIIAHAFVKLSIMLRDCSRLLYLNTYSMYVGGGVAVFFLEKARNTVKTFVR